VYQRVDAPRTCRAEHGDAATEATDYLAGMTDRFALTYAADLA